MAKTFVIKPIYSSRGVTIFFFPQLLSKKNASKNYAKFLEVLSFF